MEYYLGIDGGGTKTHLMLCDGDGRVLGEAFCGGSAHPQVGVAGVGQVVREGLQNLLAPLGLPEDDIAAVGWGLPYYGEFAAEDAQLREMAQGFLPRAKKRLCNDVEVGMAGSLGLRPGAHIVAGTGAIAMAMDAAGRTVRCGGWHEDFSDEGSGYWLGLQTLGLFTRQADGRLPAGPLLAEVRAAYSLREDMDINQYYVENLKGSRSATARVQLLLEKAALAGDEAAAALYARAAAELFAMAKGAAGALGMYRAGLAVSYFGGVFKAGELVLGPLRALCQAAGLLLEKPLLSPAAGAVLLAVREKNPGRLDAVRAALTGAE